MEFLTNIAEWCMPFLYFLRDIGNPVFDFFFETITHLGEETVFLVIAIIFFWCVDKREGYFILLSGLFGTLINQAAKLVCRVPRPWVIDPEFQPIGNSKIEATGYSFPSGHTQNTATTFGCIAAHNHKMRRVTVLSVIVIALVSFSRMYLGVHTLLDVVTSLLISLGIVLLLRPWFETEKKFDRAFPVIIIAFTILSAVFLGYVLYIRGDAGLDVENYNSAFKNACTLLGSSVGLVVVWFVDSSYVNFDTKASWYAQIIKVAIGFAFVLCIKVGLSTPLTALFGNEQIARMVRYFLIVVFAGAVWPLTFKKFAALKINVFEKFGKKIKSIFIKKA